MKITEGTRVRWQVDGSEGTVTTVCSTGSGMFRVLWDDGSKGVFDEEDAMDGGVVEPLDTGPMQP